MLRVMWGVQERAVLHEAFRRLLKLRSGCREVDCATWGSSARARGTLAPITPGARAAAQQLTSEVLEPGLVHAVVFGGKLDHVVLVLRARPSETRGAERRPAGGRAGAVAGRQSSALDAGVAHSTHMAPQPCPTHRHTAQSPAGPLPPCPPRSCTSSQMHVLGGGGGDGGVVVVGWWWGWGGEGARAGDGTGGAGIGPLRHGAGA